MSTLWGIAIGSVILIAMTYLMVQGQESIDIYHEQQELLLQCRTVQMALTQVVEAIAESNWRNASYHISVAKMRHESFVPKHEDNKKIHQLLGVVITHIIEAGQSARHNDVSMVRSRLTQATVAYNTCVQHLREQIHAYEE
jgi:hypothetical protein